MARNFNAANTEYLSATATLVSAWGFSMACWFKLDLSSTSCVVSLCNNATDVGHYSLWVSGNTLGARAVNNSGSNATASISGIVNNRWHFGGATFAGATSRTVYLDTSSSSNGTNVGVFQARNTVAIGAQIGTMPLQLFTGATALAAIWNVALNADEMNAMAMGADPYKIRPQNLVGGWPMN